MKVFPFVFAFSFALGGVQLHVARLLSTLSCRMVGLATIVATRSFALCLLRALLRKVTSQSTVKALRLSTETFSTATVVANIALAHALVTGSLLKSVATPSLLLVINKLNLFMLLVRILWSNGPPVLIDALPEDLVISTVVLRRKHQVLSKISWCSLSHDANLHVTGQHTTQENRMPKALRLPR